MRDAVEDSFRIALEAAASALERAGDALGIESRPSLVEATWWISAADAYLQEAYRSSWRADTVTQQDRDLLDGVFWARSRAFHDPLSLTTLDNPGAFSSAFDTALRWRPWKDVEKISVALDRPDTRITNRRPEYGRSLAGRPVLDTLREALAVLESVDLDVLGNIR